MSGMWTEDNDAYCFFCDARIGGPEADVYLFPHPVDSDSFLYTCEECARFWSEGDDLAAPHD